MENNTTSSDLNCKTYSLKIKPFADTAFSPKEQEVIRMFGLTTDNEEKYLLQPTKVPTEGIVYITGYSGSGKTTLLNLIKNDRPDCAELARIENPGKILLDFFPDLTAKQIVVWLSKFGLGEPRLYTLPFKFLSEGQKFRFLLALTLKKDPKIIVIDEFLSLLDRVTAKVVAYNFQKICREKKITAYLASPNQDILDSLLPDHVINIDLNGYSQTTGTHYTGQRRAFPELSRMRVEEGTIEDYLNLSKFHYVDDENNDITNWDSQLRQVIRVTYGGKTVGVCVFVTPYPEAFNKIEMFREVNKAVLWRYRTIIHPAFRGIGLTTLLQPQKDDPHVKAVVSYSALGLYFPFLLKSGYEKFDHPGNKRLVYHDELEKILLSARVDNFNNLQKVSYCRKIFAGLSREQAEKINHFVKNILIENNVDYALFLSNLIGLDLDQEKYRTTLTGLFTNMFKKIDESVYSVMLGSAMYWPVQGFYKYL